MGSSKQMPSSRVDESGTTLVGSGLAHHRPFGVRGLLACLATVLSLGWAAPAHADKVTVDCPLRIARDGSNVVVVWQIPAECDTNLTLQSASGLSGPWSTIPAAAHPFIPDTGATNQFFRAELVLPVGAPTASEIAQ